ncbi:MAG: 2'-5' RNA ligase [Coxiella sp. RIFCSPHIGHO2_12_FULL_42_15]|nr:MAG: 2'-5' RNA ligase [Coxiella sp. RIFCSPHIGHO2_12_FULL_42_15]
MIRTFFGIPLTNDSISQLTAECNLLRPALGPKVHWIDPHLWHVTIKFMGAIEPSALTVISEVVANGAAETSKFQLIVKKISSFPKSCSRTVAAYLYPHPKLSHLHNLLDRAAEKMGVIPEARRFRPHVTVAKFHSTPMQVDPLFCAEFEIPVTELVLYESRPTAQGSHYIPLQHFKLLE